MEKSRDTGMRNGNRPRTSVGNDTAKDKRVRIYWVFKGKKQLNNIPEIWHGKV